MEPATGGLLPVLWLTGPPAVGKTAVAWELFSELTDAGTEAAYVDIDQLGICRPDPPDDPGRYRVEARNLAALLTNFHGAGARCAVVSGVIDPAQGLYPDVTAHAAVTLCRLRAEPAELRARFARRRGDAALVDDALGSAWALDASDLAGLSFDTTGLSVREVVGGVQELAQGWSRRPASTRPSAATEPAPSPLAPGDNRVLWLCGARGVGKSTAGFELFQRAARAGRRIAYVDLRQVGFHRPAPAGDPHNHRLKARNAGALWRTYRGAGVQDLVLVGPAESWCTVEEYTARLEATRFTLCRLHAGAEALTNRIMLRREGGSWAEPGDRLKGQSAAWLARIAEKAAAESDALDGAGIGGLRIETDGLTAGETARAVAAAAGWA